MEHLFKSGCNLFCNGLKCSYCRYRSYENSEVCYDCINDCEYFKTEYHKLKTYIYHNHLLPHIIPDLLNIVLEYCN